MRRVLRMSTRLQPATWKASDAAAKPVGALVDRVSLGRPFRESIACVDRALQSRIKGAERFAELLFERRDAVPAEHEFGGVVQEFAQGLAWG